MVNHEGKDNLEMIDDAIASLPELYQIMFGAAISELSRHYPRREALRRALIFYDKFIEGNKPIAQRSAE